MNITSTVGITTTAKSGNVKIEAGVDGGTLTTVTASTSSDANNLDLTPWVLTPDQWYEIKFTPLTAGAKFRIEANVFVQCFINSS
jgi:hypothetical protein